MFRRLLSDCRRPAILSFLLILLAVLFIFASNKPTIAQQAQGPMTSHLRVESDMLLFFLRVATGEQIECTGECIYEQRFQPIMEQMTLRCEKVGPEFLRNSPLYNRPTDEAILARLESACRVLTSARRALGEPADTDGWRQKAVEAKKALQAK